MVTPKQKEKKTVQRAKVKRIEEKKPKQQAQKRLKNSLILLQQRTFPALLKINAV